MRCWLVVYLLVTIFSAWDCECGQRQVEPQIDPIIFALNTTSAEKIGSIDGTMPSLKVIGDVTVNKIPTNVKLQLAVLVAPVSLTIEEATKAFQSSGYKLDPAIQEITEVPGTNLWVCPASTFTAGQTGSVSQTIVFKSPLTPGKYHVYYIAYSQEYGTRFSLNSQKFEIENPGPGDPTIKIDSTLTQVSTSSAKDSQITVSATATNFGGLQGGFLFIPTTSIETPQKLIAGCLKDSRTIPLTSDFAAFVGHTDVIMHSFKIGGKADANNQLNAASDATSVVKFKPGATYRVYAYLFSPLTKAYVVSSENSTIAIPDIEVILSMTEVKLDICIQYLKPVGNTLPPGGSDKNLNSIVFQTCKGDITTNRGTQAVQPGFLFVRQGGPAADVKLVETLLKQSPKDQDFYKDIPNNTFLYKHSTKILDGTTGPIAQRLEYNGRLFNLPGIYDVYFWLQDGQTKAVYMSANSQSVQLGIDDVDQFEQITDFVLITTGEDVTLNKLPAGTSVVQTGAFNNINNVSTSGYMILNNLPQKTLFKDILTQMINVPPDVNGAFATKNSLNYNNATTVCIAQTNLPLTYENLQNVYTGTAAGAKGNLWVFAARGQSVVYQACDKQFVYVLKNKKLSLETVRVGPTLYEVWNEANTHINERVSGGSSIILKWNTLDDRITDIDSIKQATNPGNQKIVQVLSGYFKIGIDPDYDKILRFIQRMDTV